LDRTFEILDRAIRETRSNEGFHRPYRVDEIDNIYLVGGSTRLPFIEKRIERFFGKPAYGGPRREDAVAFGCAILGSMVAAEIRDNLLIDSRPFAWGVEVAGGDIVTIVNKNVAFPIRRGKDFIVDAGLETTISIRIYNGGGASKAGWSFAGAFEHTTRNGGVVNLEVIVDMQLSGRVMFTSRDKDFQTTAEWSWHPHRPPGLAPSSPSVLRLAPE
jgi:molecular chaperone DnaK